MRSEKLFLALSFTVGGLLWQPADAQQTSLVSAVLPASRAVQVGAPATAFATMINSGSVTATGCQIAPPAGLAADFYYQATDPATNAPIPGFKNVPVDIGPGQPQSFLIAVTPQAPFAAQDVRLRFYCANAPDAAVYSGLNTLLLSSSSTPGPDVVALAATVNGDGIVNVPGPTGTGFFAVATVNLGAGATISASANTGNSALPVGLSICQTNPATGSCLAPPSASVTTSISAGATPTFAVFAAGSDYIAFHPAGNRISVVFRDAGGAVKGATSVAVRTLGTPPANVAPVANAGAAQSVTTGSTVTLDGSGSSDANGDPLTYAWTLTSKPVGSVASLSGATTARPSFVADLTGTFLVTLVVNDGKVNSVPSTVPIAAATAIPTVAAIDTSNRSVVVDRYRSELANQPTRNWTGDAANCVPGTVSDAYRAAMVQRVNYFRAMAGVASDLRENAQATTEAQAAALMMNANQTLNHYPPNTWTCYTSTGATGAGRSNLYWGWSAPLAGVLAYMADGGANNFAVGHRRWLLYSRLDAVGIGEVSNAAGTFNAINVLTPAFRPAPPQQATPWPNRGFVPREIFEPQARWSFSCANADFSATTVTMTDSQGRILPITVDSRTDNGYGDNTIVWYVMTAAVPAGWDPGANSSGVDSTFSVAVNGVANCGVSSHSYTTTIVKAGP